MTADICDHSENLADLWHGTEHGPDTLDFREMQAGSCARTCVHVRVRFGDVPVLLRNSKDQKVGKQKDGKDGKILLGL